MKVARGPVLTGVGGAGMGAWNTFPARGQACMGGEAEHMRALTADNVVVRPKHSKASYVTCRELHCA